MRTEGSIQEIGQDEDTKCPSNCKNGQVACPDHTQHDGDTANPYCIRCDQPMDEINPTVNCQDCL